MTERDSPTLQELVERLRELAEDATPGAAAISAERIEEAQRFAEATKFRSDESGMAGGIISDLLTALDDKEAEIARLKEANELYTAQLAGERRNIAGWIAARDAQLARAEHAERQLDEALAGIRARDGKPHPDYDKDMTP